MGVTISSYLSSNTRYFVTMGTTYLVLCVVLVGIHTGFTGQFFSDSDTFWVGDNPVLQYLLRCKMMRQNREDISTDDIYTKKQMENGIKKLQKLAGIDVTGEADEEVLKIVEKNKCVSKISQKKKNQYKQDCECNGRY